MPLELIEQVNSRNLTEARRDGQLERTLEQIFVIKGSDDPTDPEVLLMGPQPSSAYGDGSRNLYLISRRYEVLPAGPVKALRLIATFGPPERLPAPNDTAEPQYELDLMSQTIHIEEALEQTHYPASANTVKNAIAVTDDSIDGTDIHVPKGAYSETHERQSITAAYRTQVMNLVGTVNKYAFKGWQPYEVLFLGAKASRKGKGVWTVKYAFSVQPTVRQEIDTVSGTQVFDKPGWDYMWLERRRSATNGGNDIEQQITAAHVARVYEAKDFALLGIGIK